MRPSKNLNVKGGGGIGYYVSVFLICIINLHIENIKNIIIKCYLTEIIFKNSIKIKKKEFNLDHEC